MRMVLRSPPGVRLLVLHQVLLLWQVASTCMHCMSSMRMWLWRICCSRRQLDRAAAEEQRRQLQLEAAERRRERKRQLLLQQQEEISAAVARRVWALHVHVPAAPLSPVAPSLLQGR